MLVLRFFDGSSFFAGLLLVLAGGLLYPIQKQRWQKRLALCSAVVGIVMVLISAVAQPFWAYVIWTMVAVQVLIVGPQDGAQERVRKRRRAFSIALVLLTLALAAAELPYVKSPRINVPSHRSIYVIGDSLSAGIGQQERCWPRVLGDRMGCPVVNLAVGGATAESAAAQLPRVDRPGQVVILEIGGNDLLGGTRAADFRRGLENLLSALSAQGHLVLMFELPLYPFCNAYGSAQRELAKKHNVQLIPKRYLTYVIGMPDGTLDGLHFSQKGHDTMAARVAELLNMNMAPAHASVAP